MTTAQSYAFLGAIFLAGLVCGVFAGRWSHA